MASQIINHTWLRALIEDPTLSAGSNSMLLAFALHESFNRNTSQCNPGTDQLMKMTRLSERSITRARKELGDLGWLKVRRGFGHQSIRYELTFPASHTLSQPSKPVQLSVEDTHLRVIND